MQSIVLLHGALGASSDFELLEKALLIHEIRTYSFSFSGHAKVPFEANFGVEQFTTELHDFLVKQALTKTSLFGYSMGGYVALNYALQNADGLNQVITLGTKFNWSDEAVEKETKQLNPDVLEKKVPAFAGDLKLKHGPDWQNLLIKTAALMREINEKQFLAPEQLKKINTPVTLGLGDKDNMVSLQETLEVYQTLPNSKLFILPGTKHALASANVGLLSLLIKQQLCA